MNQIKILLLSFVVLLFEACSFWGGVPETHIGTLSSVKQKDVTGNVMGFISSRTFSYKLEILTSEGTILRGVYEDGPNKYRPGDFVQVVISGDAIDDIKILERPIMDSHY
jgi:hypothetical protein